MEQEWEKKYEEVVAVLKEKGDNLSLINKRNECLAHLGREKEMYDFPWGMIDMQTPEQEDIEAVGYLYRSLQRNQWTMESDFYKSCHFHMQRDKVQIPAWDESKVDISNPSTLYDRAWYFYGYNDVIKANFFFALYLRLSKTEEHPLSTEVGQVLTKRRNAPAQLNLLLGDDADSMAFVIDSMSQYDMYLSLARLCKSLKKKVYLILPGVDWEMEGNNVLLEQAIALSYENAEEVEGVTCMTSIRFQKNGVLVEDSLLGLLDDLSKKAKGNQLLLMAERRVFCNMHSQTVKRNVLHYVAANSKIKSIPFETTFGYVNGYANFCKMLYHMDIVKELNKKSKYDFSVVIPVRNNPTTLVDTIRTCLNQNYPSYEILISDNSDPGNDSIERMIQEKFSEEKKVRYIRTPQVLPISKSFEFAYGNARGEFLVPIGADDGLVFGSLAKLHEAYELLSKEETINILSWDRLHYVWPSLTSSGQQSQFIVPRMYRKGQEKVTRMDSQEKLKDMLVYPRMMYSIPISYINSGMRRQYLLEVLEKTNAMIDGHSQDLYTGVMNLALNDHYYHLEFPITMAALSNNSSGAESSVGSVSKEITQKREREVLATNIANPVQRDSENLIMVSDGDVANMITQVFRLIDMECLDKNTVNYVYWEKIGQSIYEQMQQKDSYRHLVLKRLCQGIQWFAPEVAEKLKNEVEKGEVVPNFFDQIKGKIYRTGFEENGALHLDASKFGVENVYDACQLFDNIYHIY